MTASWDPSNLAAAQAARARAVGLAMRARLGWEKKHRGWMLDECEGESETTPKSAMRIHPDSRRICALVGACRLRSPTSSGRLAVRALTSAFRLDTPNSPRPLLQVASREAGTDRRRRLCRRRKCRCAASMGIQSDFADAIAESGRPAWRCAYCNNGLQEHGCDSEGDAAIP
ncbi:hypothetical protein FA95DRAFT_1560813 [Auriscalpium vulgare]|uniref:Uncharacterized protein n=1 Tax=Auriscalpium vulgare TaxID=40419 RepID=A0ACB8RPA3_9AGAM|nr:hypothetical protein FA95DRAFT_1560813 [Auriscalpium vulgare]